MSERDIPVAMPTSRDSYVLAEAFELSQFFKVETRATRPIVCGQTRVGHAARLRGVFKPVVSLFFTSRETRAAKAS
jgi:hypothetical protein